MASKFAAADWLRKKKLKLHSSPSSTAVRIADLFCGCGGLTLGAAQYLQSAGLPYEVAFAGDMSPDAARVFKDNFPIRQARFLDRDIKYYIDGEIGAAITPTERKLRKKFGRLDLMLAGPPCQGHSDLNNHSRRDDNRNLLYLSVIRAVEIFLPGAVLIENVPAVVHDKKDVVATAHRYLRSLGYATSDETVNALNVGLPQRRKRHFLIASRYGLFSLPAHLSTKPTNLPTLRSAIEDLAAESEDSTGLFRTPSRTSADNKSRIDHLFKHNIYDLPDAWRPPCHRDKEHSYKSVYGRLKWDLPAQTITSGFGSMGQGRYIHPSQRRTITPHEAARIQGFPDFFSFDTAAARTSLHEMIGNAVPPPLASELVRVIVEKNLLRGEPRGQTAA